MKDGDLRVGEVKRVMFDRVVRLQILALEVLRREDELRVVEVLWRVQKVKFEVWQCRDDGLGFYIKSLFLDVSKPGFEGLKLLVNMRGLLNFSNCCARGFFNGKILVFLIFTFLSFSSCILKIVINFIEISLFPFISHQPFYFRRKQVKLEVN